MNCASNKRTSPREETFGSLLAIERVDVDKLDFGSEDI